MSEFQSYEWVTLGRTLTEAQMAEVNSLSSHIEVSPAYAAVTYNWGSFKHDPAKVLARYFDAFLYWANWGTKELLLRLPDDLVDEQTLSPYLWEYHVELEDAESAFILSIKPCPEDEADWIAEGYSLAALAHVRDDILLGDYRALYLAWLRSAELEDAQPEEMEPPVPPGLRDLTPALRSLVHFLDLDEHVLAAAAQQSPPPEIDVLDIENAVVRLNRSECHFYLTRLARNEPYLAIRLRRRLRQLAGCEQPEQAARRRTWGEITATADDLRRAAEQRQRAEAEARRIAALEALAARETETWAEVDQMIVTKTPRGYTGAVSLLVQLKDLAIYQKRTMEFEARITEILERYASRPSLRQRLREAGLA